MVVKRQDDELDESALTGAEGELLVASAARSRAADKKLAAALGRAEPSRRATSTGYLDDLARRSAPSQADERALVAAAQAGDAAARARLVETFMPLIALTARVDPDSPAVDRVELLQEGVVGLLRALERFDLAREVPFWGYASFWVRQAMQQLVAELTRPLVLSDRALRQLARIKDAHGSLLQETGHEPSRDDLAARAGLEPSQIDGLLAAEGPARSLDEPAGGEGAVGAFGDLLVDPLAEGEYERVIEAIEAEQLLALLAGLSEREREVLRARFGLDGEPQSLRDVGGRLGLSAERVRQIEERALGKLAAAIGA
jgi:RNA polymerase sigma factor (sigma-70 family)